ncbi:MAG TPA: bilirubin oxidase [Chloroflexi bacterium]|nr:bilirubin oxidase [Chloroflexota bacterium]HHW85033.1 multicopper oxidase domain-containing protein [Chloroflexota bacterium]
MNRNIASHNPPLSRRRFLIYSGTGAAALWLSACTGAALPLAQSPTPPATDAPAAAASTPALEFQLTAGKQETPILPGVVTRTLGYTGNVVQGDANAVVDLPNSYLGPIVRVTRGQTVRVHVRNELDEPTNVHWHGLIVPAEADGQPSNLIAPGAEVECTFEVRNRPGTYWFHPHPHGRTAEQAYQGLAGLFIVTDSAEAALGLPAGAQDIPLVIQDRRFDANNQLIYIAPGMAGMMDEMMGILGERVLVNGAPDLTLPVATQPYRLRLLNGSNARIYKLAWSNGAPMTVIATDGGLLEHPMTMPYVMLSPGERVELWADFSQDTVGTEVKLVSLPFEGVEAATMSMMGMMMPEPTLPNGAAFDIMTFAVTEAVTHSLSLPETLLPVEKLDAQTAVNADRPRAFIFAMDDAMNWTINGRTFEMDVVADDEKVRFGDTEIWELVNLMVAPAPVAAGGMMGMDHSAHGGSAATQSMMRDFMAHPVHLHGVHFQVLDRQVDDAQRAGWETVKDGLLDEGWKDSVLVMPGERVRIAVRFDGYRGRYLFHCHNLEHEDSGMMRYFEVV